MTVFELHNRVNRTGNRSAHTRYYIYFTFTNISSLVDKLALNIAVSDNGGMVWLLTGQGLDWSLTDTKQFSSFLSKFY